MKSMLVIGLGRFGQHLAATLLELGNDVMIVDEDEKNLEPLVPYATSSKIGDCTNPEVLKSLGIGNFDVIFVCIGTNFQSSLEVTSLVKELGGKYVVSKATREIQAKFLLRNGADEVVYPEKDIAENCAMRFSMNHVFDYIELSEEYGIYEITPLHEWVGKSIRESNIAARYRVSILGIKNEADESQIMPSADYVIKQEEHLLVLASHETVEKLMAQLDADAGRAQRVKGRRKGRRR